MSYPIRAKLSRQYRNRACLTDIQNAEISLQNKLILYNHNYRKHIPSGRGAVIENTCDQCHKHRINKESTPFGKNGF